MGPISAEIEVDASREAAFELISDFCRRPNFTDHFLTDFHLTRIDARGRAPGRGSGSRRRCARPGRTRRSSRSRRPSRSKSAAGRPHEPDPEPDGLGDRAGPGGHDPAPRHPLDDADESRRPLVESLSWGAHFQRKGWKGALKRLRDILEAEGPGGERIAVAGGTATRPASRNRLPAADVPDPPTPPAPARRPGWRSWRWASPPADRATRAKWKRVKS